MVIYKTELGQTKISDHQLGYVVDIIFTKHYIIIYAEQVVFQTFLILNSHSKLMSS